MVQVKARIRCKALLYKMKLLLGRLESYLVLIATSVPASAASVSAAQTNIWRQMAENALSILLNHHRGFFSQNSVSFVTVGNGRGGGAAKTTGCK